MKTVLTFIFFMGLTFVFFPSPTQALDFTPVPRYAECDICGYCNQRKEPGNWGSCASCLYPAILTITPSPLPTHGYTLEKKYPPEYDPPTTENEYYEKIQQVTPYPGRYYTQLGCVNTSLESFANPAASGGLLNFLLNKLIFPTVGVLAFLTLVYGAFVLATAQGNPEQIAKGKSLILGAMIGLVFTLSSIFIIRLIGGDILRIPWLTR
jgi:hypothetical protein